MEAVELGALRGCPQCRQELDPAMKHSVKSIDRIIKRLKVRCALQHEQDEQEREAEQEQVPCVWTGDLGDLQNHIEQKCDLTPMVCEHCQGVKQRHEMEQHVEVCPEKKMACSLGCS